MSTPSAQKDSSLPDLSGVSPPGSALVEKWRDEVAPEPPALHVDALTHTPPVVARRDWWREGWAAGRRQSAHDLEAIAARLDDLEAIAARLDAQLDMAYTQAATDFDAGAALKELEAECARLHQYVQHKPDCEKWVQTALRGRQLQGDLPCTCDLIPVSPPQQEQP